MRIVLIPELFMDMDVDFNMSQMIHWLDYFTGQDTDIEKHQRSEKERKGCIEII